MTVIPSIYHFLEAQFLVNFFSKFTKFKDSENLADPVSWRRPALEVMSKYIEQHDETGTEKLDNLMTIVGTIDKIGQVQNQWVKNLSTVLEKSDTSDKDTKLIVELSQRSEPSSE